MQPQTIEPNNFISDQVNTGTSQAATQSHEWPKQNMLMSKEEKLLSPELSIIANENEIPNVQSPVNFKTSKF